MLNFLLSAFSLSALSDNPTALTITIIMAVLIVVLIIMDIVDRSKAKKAAAEKKSNAVETKTENTEKSSVINEDVKPQPIVDVVPDAKPEPKFVESVMEEKVEEKEIEKAENKAVQSEKAEEEKADKKVDAKQNIEKVELKPETENETEENKVIAEQIAKKSELKEKIEEIKVTTEDEKPVKENIVKEKEVIEKLAAKKESCIKIAKGKDDGFHFYLYDENGNVIFESKRYASPATSKRGINAFKRNVTELNYKIEKEKKDYYFIIRKGNTIYKGLNFKSSDMAEENAKKVKEFAFDAKIVE